MRAWSPTSAPPRPATRPDRKLNELIRELRAHSPRFAELWQTADVPQYQERSRHNVVDHPEVGRISVDCDVLIVAGDDLRIMVYTAEPGSDAAERLVLAIVLGTQHLVG